MLQHDGIIQYVIHRIAVLKRRFLVHFWKNRWCVNVLITQQSSFRGKELSTTSRDVQTEPYPDLCGSRTGNGTGRPWHPRVPLQDAWNRHIRILIFWNGRFHPITTHGAHILANQKARGFTQGKPAAKEFEQKKKDTHV